MLLKFLLLILLSSLVNTEESKDLDNGNGTIPKQTLKEAEKEISNFVNDQLRSILPRVVGGAGNSQLSQKCTAGMMKVFGNLRRLKGWTFKFLDSIGKPSSGILKGTAYSIGHYDQCLDLAITNKGHETENLTEAFFQGMYCTVQVRFVDVVISTGKQYHRGEMNETDLGKLKEIIQASPYVPVMPQYMSHFLGICLPSVCTMEDVKELVQLVPFPGVATVERCEIKTENSINTTQLALLCALFVLGCVIFISTFVDWFLHNGIEDKLSSRDDKKCVSVIISFSFFKNTKKLMRNIEDDCDSAVAENCVRGLIVASIAWIILGHTYLMPFDAFYMQSSSLENLRNYLNKVYFSLVVNSPLAIDALFVSYGFIMTYTLWYSACKPEDVKVNVFRLIIQTYLRIFIPVLLYLGLVFLLPLIGSGPFWNDIMDGAISQCYKNFNAYIGMYSNFLDPSEQCFPHLWFPSCLAQLSLIGIFLSWILSKNTKFGIAVVILLMLAANIFVGIYTYNNSLPPSYIPYFQENSTPLFWKLNYSLPLSHLGPYVFGMLTGIFAARRSRYPLRPILAVIGWIICTLVLGGLFLFTYKHRNSIDNFWSALYAGTHRTLFAISISWVIITCSFGNGGFVNGFLSWRIFDPFFRLSYYAYIFHFIVIAFTVAVSRDHFQYSHLELVLRAISYISVTYFVSYLCYMVIEMPLKSLCCSLCKQKSSQINVTPLNNIYVNKEDITSSNDVIKGTCKLWSVYSNTSPAY